MGRLLRTHFSALLLAAVLPFVCSHLVVLLARQIGMPYRLGLDFVHGLFVLSYLTVVVQLRFDGLAKFGFAVARPRWPGFQPLILAVCAVVLIGLPAALVLHPAVQALESLADQNGGAWALVPTVMFPEFIMTTLIGLALAAGKGKVSS